MSEYKQSILDCTLRDGGYINDWKFGYKTIQDIIISLVEANINIIEVGFLRNDTYNQECSVWNNVTQLKSVLPSDRKNVLFSAMALHNKYDIDKLEYQEETGIDILRVTFHDYDINEGLAFCQKAMEKGYKVSCNPINIMGYSDKDLLDIIEKVNWIQPYAFAIVDTFGSMNNKDLDRLISIFDHNLNSDITLGLHLHENKAQSFSLAQRFVEKHIKRDTIIDASLNGMGRVPGNLSLELITDYLNENFGTNYEIDSLLEAIETYIEPIKEKSPWGYSPVYFLSAKYNLHRNYAEFLLNRGNLTHKDINHLLSRIEKEKKTAFDENYVKNLYEAYMNHEIDDQKDRKTLIEKMIGKEVLIIAPGSSINDYRDKIKEYTKRENICTVALNFRPEGIAVDYVLFTNNKRYMKYYSDELTVIITSNIEGQADYLLNYNSLVGSYNQGSNSLIMAIRLMKDLSVKKIYIAGADGYQTNTSNYCDSRLRSYIKHDGNFNAEVKQAIQVVDIDIEYVTPSLYV